MRSLYALVVLALSLIAVHDASVVGAETPPPNEVPQLQLSATAVMERPADQVTIMLGVVTTEDKAADSIRQNAKKMEESLEALKKAGLTKDEYQTSSFEIDPLYTPRPRNPPSDWKEKIVGYRVSNQLIIKTNRINDVGMIIDAATSAGTNSIDGIVFGLKDQRAYRDKVITQATKNAMADAKTIADAAQISLGRILNISIGNLANNDHNLGMQRSKMMAEASYFGADPSTSIQAGDVTIQATVNIVFEIQDSH